MYEALQQLIHLYLITDNLQCERTIVGSSASRLQTNEEDQGLL